DLGDRGSADQVLQRAESEHRVFEVLLERPQNEIAPQLLVQVRPYERKNAGELAFDLLNPPRQVWLAVEVELLAGIAQQLVQLGFAFGDERGGNVEFVPGEGPRGAPERRTPFENQLV